MQGLDSNNIYETLDACLRENPVLFNCTKDTVSVYGRQMGADMMLTPAAWCTLFRIIVSTDSVRWA